MATLIRFFHNHGFLGLQTHFQWYTVDGGAREYVKRLCAVLPRRTKFSGRALAVERVHGETKAKVFSVEGSELFDKVILACHADQALAILSEPNELESELLSVFKYEKNQVTVHTDDSIMPREKLAWASWNYRIDRAGDCDHASTHYWMNNLQGLKSVCNYFVSLNSDSFINPAQKIKEITYHHPLFDLHTASAQPRLAELNNVSDEQSVYFCGSYFRYGFHEDALTSALDLTSLILEASQNGAVVV